MGYDALAIKYFYLTAHYRSELKFNFDILDAAAKTFSRLQNKVYSIKNKVDNYNFSSNNMNKELVKLILDDLDTPRVLAKFHEVLNSNISDVEKLNAVNTMDSLFGLEFMNFEPVKDVVPENVTKLAEERLNARKNKEWSKSDELRDEIKELGFTVKDENDGFILSKN